MRTLSLAETKAHLSAVVDEVAAGEEIVITRRGRPVARIVPEPTSAAADAVAAISGVRDFVLSQPELARSTLSVVCEARESERY